MKRIADATSRMAFELLAASLAAPKARCEEEQGAIAELRKLGFVEE
ncbi:MAG: hypothetical protein ACN6PJ_10380 [Achromobacter sp.]